MTVRGIEYRGVVISRGEWVYHAGNGRRTVIPNAWVTTVDDGRRMGFRTRAAACQFVDDVLARVGQVSTDLREYRRTVFVDGVVTVVPSSREEWRLYRDSLAG